MEFEFDKEIDFLLRQTAQSETASARENSRFQTPNSKSNHLDADEIAAFAENALPEKARLNYIAHFADCDRCRKILSNVVALESAARSEIIHAEEPPLLTEIAPEIPWYRKFFAVPNLVYAMGAMVLLFSGIGVYIVLQSGSRDAQVSQSYEKQIGGKGMSSDGDAATIETFSMNSNSQMSNMAATNTAANAAVSNSASATNLANSSMFSTAANSNAMARNRDADKDLTATKPAETLDESSDSLRMQGSVTSPAPAPPAKEVRSENESAQQLNVTPQQNEIVQNQQNQTQMKPDSRSAQRAPTSGLSTENKLRKLEEAKDDAPKKSAETTNVAGKFFRRENNVWYDTTYRGQATVNVSRGTNEYKKLDKGLRQIVERIGGTVVVIWKEKAYRIQ